MCVGVPAVPSDGELQFALVKDDSRYQFGADKEKEREQWVKALYLATGQTQQPSRQKVDVRSDNQPGVSVCACTCVCHCVCVCCGSLVKRHTLFFAAVPWAHV